MERVVSVAQPHVSETQPETAFQAYARRLLRPDKIADLDRKFPRSKYQSETDRARAMLEHINAQFGEQPLLPDGFDFAGLHQTFATVKKLNSTSAWMRCSIER